MTKDEILDLATQAKQFSEDADVDPPKDENLIRAAVVFAMLQRQGMVTPDTVGINKSHAVALIAAGYDDSIPSTADRRDLFAVALET